MPLKPTNLPLSEDSEAPRTIAAPRATLGQYIVTIILVLLGLSLCGYAYYIW